MTPFQKPSAVQNTLFITCRRACLGGTGRQLQVLESPMTLSFETMYLKASNEETRIKIIKCFKIMLN